MGGFFLYSKKERIDEDRVRGLFSVKGFGAPAEFLLGDARLWIHRKQLIDHKNFCHLGSGEAIFAIGTPIYRGLGYASSLKRLLRDKVAGRLDRSQILGSFCLLFWCKPHLQIMTDAGDMLHVFANSPGTVLSSSLQAVLVAGPTRYEINRAAILEQLLTGTITGPDTSFSDIILVNRNEQEGFESEICEFVVDCSGSREDAEYELGFDAEVDAQLATLREYFRSISPLAQSYGIDIGLSGGYDSRLLLLLAKETGGTVSTHTFAGVAHSVEREIATELARMADVPLLQLPLKLLEDRPCQEIATVVEDALHYYDGRTNMTMGTFNDVHTRAARIIALGGKQLGLNGLGGELYRNREHLSRGRIDCRQWVQYYVFDPGTAASVGERIRNSLAEVLITKYSRLIGSDLRAGFNRKAARGYYRRVWLPYSVGPKNAAENQLAFFLLPFADPSVTKKSMRIDRHLGRSGHFEGAMIRRLDQYIAAIGSSYGHGLGAEPISSLTRAWVRSILPIRARNLAGRCRARQMVMAGRTKSEILTPHKGLREGLELLRSLDLPIDWRTLLADRTHRDRALYLGGFLKAFCNHISVPSGSAVL